MSPSAIRNGFSSKALILRGSFIGSEILQEYGLGNVCQCRVRGMRIFLIHQKNQQIVAELALSAEEAGNGLVKRPQFYLLKRRGFIKTQPLPNLCEEVGRLDNFNKHRR